VVGYDHAISPSVTFLLEQVRSGRIGEVLTIDVEFREHWEGIFKAHPWLSGPHDSYLGFSERGGGASGEHSHALHLWLNIAKACGWGDIAKVADFRDYVSLPSGACYDQVASFTIATESGRIGRVVQDVVTKPSTKSARVQGTDGFIEWVCNVSGVGDVVYIYQNAGELMETRQFLKKRPDDFFEEMKHLDKILSGEIKVEDSPISLEFGALVMKILRRNFS
jgi:predicted dehydrogenase